MNIAVIGWGSLVWQPGSLRLRTRWRCDGPRLPVEFARISTDGRLTLVIHPGSADVTTYWALSESRALEAARGDLRDREKAQPTGIHYAVRAGQAAGAPAGEVVGRVIEWLNRHPGVDAAIWTGLSSNWPQKRRRPFSLDDAVAFALGGPPATGQGGCSPVRDYITRAPPQTDTPVRRVLRLHGWVDVPLPADAIETDPLTQTLEG